MKRILLSLTALAALSLPLIGATPSKGIDSDMLKRLHTTYASDPSTKALRNALRSNDIDELAENAESYNNFDTEISHRVPSQGITNQKSSGRCWLFTGLNVLRSQMMGEHDLSQMKFSQNYNFFYDQLEKANLFLQGIIDTSDRPMSDRTVDWLFTYPISDGGQFTGLSDNLMKYGVVPAEVMVETYSSDNTSKLRRMLGMKLRQQGLELRRMASEKVAPAKIAARKEEMLSEIYRILALTLGEPPTQFEWTRKDIYGSPLETRTYTPQEFYAEYLGNDLKNDYVMFMNDPSREYYKVYEIDYDRHAYDGSNWTYINLPMEDIKKMAIESIKDSTMMYLYCDFNKFFDRQRGYSDPELYDYEALFGVDFKMDKADRIRSHASASTHAMTLAGVDLDKDGKPRKWLVENSWGSGANNGHLIITDPWMDEYLFRLVVNKKYVPENIMKLRSQKPILLPAWDPLFSNDD